MWSTRLCQLVRPQQLYKARLIFRYFSSSYNVPAQAGGTISESELQAARAYCSNLILYMPLPPHTMLLLLRKLEHHVLIHSTWAFQEI